MDALTLVITILQLLCGLVRRGSGAVQLTDRVRFCAGDGCFWQEIVPERPRQQEDEQQRGQPFHRASALEYSENSQPKRSTIMLSISSAFSARFTMLRRISSSEASVMSDRWMR